MKNHYPLKTCFNVSLCIGLMGSLLNVTASGQTITPTSWYNARAGAVSLTFDDSLAGHWSHAHPIMTAAGVRGTFFVITGSTDWDGARAAALDGHEIGSHSTVDATLQNDANAAAKMLQAHDAIESEIGSAVPGYRCDTIAWPYGFRRLDVTNDPAYQGLYLAARNAGNALLADNSYNKPDITQWWKYGQGTYQEDHFYVIGDALMFTGTGLSSYAAQLDLVEAQNAWTVFTYHGIETGGYQNIAADTFTQQVAAVAARMDSTLWVAPFGEVVRYIRQREAAQVEVVESSAQAIRLILSDSLDDSVFNLPMTLALDIPDGWTEATGTQADEAVPVWMAEGKLYFNAVPDAGEIVLTSASDPGPDPVAPEAVSIDVDGSGISLGFDTLSGQTYSLEGAANPGGPWSAVGGVEPIAGDDSRKTFELSPLPELPAFYRISPQ